MSKPVLFIKDEALKTQFKIRCAEEKVTMIQKLTEIITNYVKESPCQSQQEHQNQSESGQPTSEQ